MALDTNWFSEIDNKASSAFSLKIKRKLHEEQSTFQKVEIYETEKFGNLMTLDGCIMLTTRDNFVYHEMMTHPVLFTHPNPKNVVIIGGGDCGTLREVLKHPSVETVTQVDIDEAVTRASEKYFPELCESNDDPRATLLFDDGIKWMQDAADDSVDIVIVDSTDPIGPGEGLFNVAFYTQCRRVLGEKGLLIQQSESPLVHLPLLQSIHKAQREAGFDNTRSLQFFVTSYPSGWWTGTIAGQGDLSQFRREDAENLNFETLYYNAAIHQASFALPNFLQQALSA
ncbi:MAG: polyamine aminopropyltransferase [Thiotrichaceae bacterium]|nr:polyamine aminopropyltransferase [Thiotrichaceae bacterium]